MNYPANAQFQGNWFLHSRHQNRKLPKLKEQFAHKITFKPTKANILARHAVKTGLGCLAYNCTPKIYQMHTHWSPAVGRSFLSGTIKLQPCSQEDFNSLPVAHFSIQIRIHLSRWVESGFIQSSELKSLYERGRAIEGQEALICEPWQRIQNRWSNTGGRWFFESLVVQRFVRKYTNHHYANTS